ncbi:hypothetical protein KRR40_44575 [Niabella defluvii]|nr:hypothetical protein KRR40_44575 [Niabella sp. I65]
MAKEYENLGFQNFMKYNGKKLPQGDTSYKMFAGWPHCLTRQVMAIRSALY